MIVRLINTAGFTEWQTESGYSGSVRHSTKGDRQTAKHAAMGRCMELIFALHHETKEFKVEVVGG